MLEKGNNYSKYKYSNFIDIDAYQLMELVELGYSVREIAKELSVSTEQINMLRDEANKYY
ncbi:hypothetical protein [Maledivibacter halophilus]|uniref:Homeodomain-like domain-containing protein n=1 Tax=Maledivibacter halophilus TaxID=36842 RepID=A0A1T5L2E1_9FIRM|nr:hypothetical protein [Maledivibacter halophilus]SKC70103.1 hypothetical protein SAMN02194393_02375 [Maledivibacter halophilus]